MMVTCALTSLEIIWLMSFMYFNLLYMTLVRGVQWSYSGIKKVVLGTGIVLDYMYMIMVGVTMILVILVGIMESLSILPPRP